MLGGFAFAIVALLLQSMVRGVLTAVFGRTPFDVLVKFIYLLLMPIIMYNVISPTMAIISFGYAVKHVFGYDDSLSPFQQTFFALKYGRTANYVGYGIMFVGVLIIINFGTLF